MGGTTWYLHGDNNSLLYEKEIKANGITEQRHYVQAAGMTFALAVVRTGPGVSSTAADRKMRPTQLEYFQQDSQGSIVAIADETGAVIERLAYDPWGKRRYANGLQDRADSLVGVNTDRGYTLHEHLDEVGVIHMNGRVYDPLIGRFMSADPFVQSPGNLQSYNRYAYVWNNPLAMTDPSGYFSLRKLFRAVVTIVVAVYAPELSAYIGWTGGVSAAGAATAGGLSASMGMSGAVASGMLGGALSGAVATGTLKGAVLGGLTGAAFAGVGDKFAGWENVVGHAAVGCASSVGSGGGCQSGALSGAAGSMFSQFGPQFDSFAANLVANSVAGGVASVVGGGKFENGAKTAAFGYLFNQAVHAARVPGLYTPSGGGVFGWLESRIAGVFSLPLMLTGDTPQTKEYDTVNRYMSNAEYSATVETGLIRGGRPGVTYATNDYYSSSAAAQSGLALPVAPELRVTLSVPTGSFSSPSRVEPAYGQPGGGTERTAVGTIPAKILDVTRLN